MKSKQIQFLEIKSVKANIFHSIFNKVTVQSKFIGQYFIKGALDEIRIYDKALNTTEVSTVMTIVAEEVKKRRKK